MSRHAINLIDQKFGKLTVTHRHLINGKSGDAKWNCKCDCGNTSVVVASQLKKKNGTRSCGCVGLDDLTGRNFGRLLVLHRYHLNTKLGFPRWNCKCDCGTEKIIDGKHLRSGVTTSCGCYHRERASEAATKHGLTFSSEHGIWTGIKNRCYNEKEPAYKDYGGRGITVSDEWRNSFETFYKDMGPRPSKDYSIDRIDNDKGYSKENCKWATRTEQANNRRNTIFYIYKGVGKSLSTWCHELNLNYDTIYYRVKKGLSLEEAIKYN